MAKHRADIANFAVRIFLQEIGAAYDQERGFSPYTKGKHFKEIQRFFGDMCCYCGGTPAKWVQDHLVPMNRTALGLEAWGNVVPACDGCNSKKQAHNWRDFIIQRAGDQVAERHARMHQYLAKYPYDPKLDLRDVTETLYDEVGAIAMTLIDAKLKRLRPKITA